MDFKLRAQVVNASQSVSSNIAEGYSRKSINEYIQFLYISLASLSEVLTRMIGLSSTNIINSEQFKKIDTLHYEVENKLLRLIAALEKKRDDGSWKCKISEESGEYKY